MAGRYIGIQYPNGTVEVVWTEMSPSLPRTRTITTQAFFRRFTRAERAQLRKSVRDEVADLRDDLERGSSVRLDENLRQRLLDMSLLTDVRVDELMADGTEAET